MENNEEENSKLKKEKAKILKEMDEIQENFEAEQ